MRVLLLSTYELGRQPVHVSSPAAVLSAAGHDVSTADLAVETLDIEQVVSADAIAISVPMHTAMRLGIETATRIRDIRPEVPLALYGLYATVGSSDVLGRLVDRVIAGEYERGLVDWVAGGGSGASVSTGKGTFLVPDRSKLPRLDQYARLEWEGETRLAGAVEASHGCRHRCRHCPIPVVYDGRWRVVGEETVLEDIDNQVAAGARHITFGDPDFLNAPRYSMELLRKAHLAHPDVTFDVTIKVEHIVEHRRLIAELPRLGVLFIVSAFESVDPKTLEILDKNHTVADMAEAIGIVASSGGHIRPTWLPFSPWTTVSDVADMVGFIDVHRIWEATDPVQLAVRLLVPEGSLMESHPELAPHLLDYRPSSLSWTWDFAQPGTSGLFDELDRIATKAADCGAEAMSTLSEMRRVVLQAAGREVGEMPDGRPTPRLTEAWFCCSEPTPSQLVSLSVTGLQSI